MRIIIDIHHPAQVHLFRYLIMELKKKHDVIVTVSQKDINIDLLKHYSIEYHRIRSYGNNILVKLINLILIDIEYLIFCLRKKPDLLIGCGARITHIGFLLGIKSYILDDTDHAKEQIALYQSFATKIYTPDCFLRDLGPKQVRYPGYHELAYLHPKRFKPNSEVLKEIGFTEKDKFFIVRFVAWDATHDVGQKGLSIFEKRKLIDILKTNGRIIITSEKTLPAEFEEYRMSICPTKMHDLLYYSTMYIGEGGTMASEAACLGTFSIYINSLPAMGYISEESAAGLIFKSTDINEIIGFLKNVDFDELKNSSMLLSQKLLERKIDVTDYMIRQINNF